MRRAKDEQGIALVATVLLLMVMSGIGLALLLFTNNQQKASTREQASEKAFTVGEAALNSTVSQLSRQWPSKKEEAVSTCTASSTTSSNYCPDKASLETGYPNTNPTTCPGGTPKDPWGSALTNQWTTYVRDDATGEAFTSATEQTQPAYDANGDGKVWLRSVGVVQCRLVTVVTLVARQEIALSFPKNVVTADWFETTNQGNKVIVDTKGESSQGTNVSLRCNPKPSGKECAAYEKEKGQVSPGEVVEESGTSPALNSTQLEALRKQAEAGGHYYAKGSCPSGMPSGSPVYVAGPCAISGGSNEVANSKESPGFLIIANGTFSMDGSAKFYGTIYCVNQQGSSGAVVSVGGDAEIIGSIAIDGSAGASLGASGTNIVYDGTAIANLKTYAGAAATRNSFRVLPSNQ